MATTTAPVLLRPRNFQWYWNAGAELSSTSNEEQWQKYTDVGNEIIEDAFNEKKDNVEIDGDYVIDLKFMLQSNKLDNSNARLIKRVQLQTNRNNGLIREGRLSLSVDASSVSPTNTSSQNNEEQKQKDDRFSYYFYQIELAKNNKTIADAVEEAAQGIIKEGEAQNKIQEARCLSKQLLDIKAFGDRERVSEHYAPEIPSVIGDTCVYLYTTESFWYKLFNEAMRDPKYVTHERVKALQPFYFLLHNYLHQDKTYVTPTVFRAVNLTDEQRLKFLNDVQFTSFTSTSKSREVAEFYDRNTLLIIDLNIKKREGLDIGRAGADISHLSAFDAEKEFLIWPYTSFHYLRREYDKETKKYIIYLKSYQTNC